MVLNDEIVRKAKSRAALQGLSLSRYTERCLESSFDDRVSASVKDWVYELLKVSPRAVREVKQTLENANFDMIDPEMWK